MSPITPLEGVDSSSRLLRTSIYLRTSLERSDGRIKDLLDCVVPIVSDSIDQLPPGQIVLEDLGQAVMKRFSFRMPTFTIEHVLGRLARNNKVIYDKDQRVYLHQGTTSRSKSVEEPKTSKKISHLERRLSKYAKDVFDLKEPPLFSTWSDVIVYFLHPDSIRVPKSPKEIKKVSVVDIDDIVCKVVSGFILRCESENDQETFETIVEIYGGILLGDFLQNIQTTGHPQSFKDLTVLYDTTVLLRLLGSSGEKLRAATLEMNRDLQSLGCKTEYLRNNETELCNILDTIVGRYDSNQAIFGETGEALARGNDGVQIGFLRELNTGYPEALATHNVFPSKYSFQNTTTRNYFQIDELKFQELFSSGKDNYHSEQSRICDAQSLAVVMRLRHSSKAQDLGSSRFVFVTANAHLARSARIFVKKELGHTPLYVPPVLTHSQMSTAAWISREVRIQDSAISRELLANCMSAQQLSKEWMDCFAEFLKSSKVSKEDHTIVHAVRSIARDESLGNSTILRELNPNELLARARDAEMVRTTILAKKHQDELELRSKNTRKETLLSITKENDERAEKITNTLVRVILLMLAVLCTYSLVHGFEIFDRSDYWTWFQPFVFTVVTLVSVLELFQFQPIHRLTIPLRKTLKRTVYQLFYGGKEK